MDTSISLQSCALAAEASGSCVRIGRQVRIAVTFPAAQAVTRSWHPAALAGGTHSSLSKSGARRWLKHWRGLLHSGRRCNPPGAAPAGTRGTCKSGGSFEACVARASRLARCNSPCAEGEKQKRLIHKPRQPQKPHDPHVRQVPRQPQKPHDPHEAHDRSPGRV